MAQLSPLQKSVVKALKIALAVAILSYLVQRVQNGAGFERLLSEPKYWPSLSLALLLVLAAFSLSFARWYLLVRGLNLEFSLRDAFRLGALGFMFNQVSPGSVGGDLIKAVFIAKEQPGKRTEAVASVFIDRVIGLCAMLLIASLGIAFASNSLESDGLRHSLQMTIWPAAAGGILGLAFVLSPWATGKPVRSMAERLPWIGSTFLRLVDAVDVYRSQRRYLFAGFGLALLTHCSLITAFWLISQGLPVRGPTFLQNASLVPVALVAGAFIPTPGGLGVLEGSVESLYTSIGSAAGDGTLVALTYRAMTYVVASIGALYYFTSRKKVDLLLHDAEVLADETA